MWRDRQHSGMDEAECRFWFENLYSPYRIGLVCGDVSGNLVVRDFDSLNAYQRWANEHQELAESLPTVETGRPGRHVYCRSTSSMKTTSFADGEFRGNGAFVVAPPSRHESGVHYTWTRGLPEMLPTIDPAQGGMLRDWTPDNAALIVAAPASSVVTESTESTEDIFLSVTARAAVSAAVKQTLPRAEGQRHHRLFEFARRLKAVPELAGLPANDLREAVRKWHAAARPTIATKDFEETFWDFAESWDKVRYPANSQPVRVAFEAATKQPTPRCAEH